MTTTTRENIKKKIISPILEFAHDSRSVGIILLVCTAISLLIANLNIGNAYVNFWNSEFATLHRLHVPHSLIHVINDGLMAIFFLLAGMEIKRELVEGELSTIKKASLPVVAAIGGMAAPAFIFILFNKGTPYSSGWAIPASTDIAFSLGVASLLGNKVPVNLKLFLTAVAIIDDLGAIIIIAFFYGEPVKIIFLATSVLICVIIHLINKRLKFGWIQIGLGILLWYIVYNSGIHATVAGVLFAFLIPPALLSHYEHKLHSVVYFFIIPVFALANTAIIFPNDVVSAIGGTLSLGIILGLFVGKPVGICLSSYLLIKRGHADMPSGVSWKHVIGIGILAGIGFTMSIFISSLAFAEEGIRDVAKIAVLVASLVSMVVGYVWLRKASS